MPVDRMLPSGEARDLIELTRDIADRELAPIASQYEAEGRFPREAVRTLGRAGLFSLPYDEEYGGGGQPYEVYLQVLEEVAARWSSVALAMSVHVMSCYPTAAFGTPEQRERLLPRLLGGELLGAYCLSESQAGSDPSSMTTRAEKTGDGFDLTGTKAWITHGGQADSYTVFARTSDDPQHGISCFVVDAGTDGLSFGAPEKKMGMNASTTTMVNLDDVRVPAERLMGVEGQGLQIALSALDSGRLGIGALAVGLAQGALDEAVAYAKERRQFGKAIIEIGRAHV